MNDGGPAFPFVGEHYKASGMSLREYFAAAALTGLLASRASGSHGFYAREAYLYADAMLDAVKQNSKET
jgi:hypothetical protein